MWGLEIAKIFSTSMVYVTVLLSQHNLYFEATAGTDMPDILLNNLERE